MCSYDSNQAEIIRKKVEEFIDDEKMFTSVDISNAIKLDGVWIRNRIVRDWLHENIGGQHLGGYTSTLISVNNGIGQATLYMPTWADPDNYAPRDQNALTPNEVKTIRKSKIGQPNPNVAHDINSILSEEDEEDSGSDSGDITATLRSKDRLFIPGYMIKAIGWAPGDKVDSTKIKTPNIISDELKVWHDYRVSVPRSAVPWKDDPVKVTLRNGEILFDKA